MVQNPNRKKNVRDIFLWAAFVPIGLSLFAIGELVGFSYNFLADIISLGFIGKLLAYPAQLITSCIGLYIAILIALNIVPNKWLGGIIISTTFLVLFTASVVLAIGKIVAVNLFFYFEMAILMGMLVFFLIRIIPNKEKLYQ